MEMREIKLHIAFRIWEEEILYRKYSRGKVSISGGKFSLYKIIPLGDGFLYRKTSVVEDSLHRKPSGENVFYLENLPGDYSLWGMLFSMIPA